MCVIENVKKYFNRESINRLLVLLKLITFRTQQSAALDRSIDRLQTINCINLKCFPVHFAIAIYFWFAISIFYDFISFWDWRFCSWDILRSMVLLVCFNSGRKKSVKYIYQYMTFRNIPSSCTINKTFSWATQYEAVVCWEKWSYKKMHRKKGNLVYLYLVKVKQFM